MRNFIGHWFPALILVLSILLISGLRPLRAQPDEYPDPAQINRSLRALQQSNPAVSEVSLLATSPGNNEVLLLEIGKEIASAEKTNPAILVVGNLEGNRPLASLAALSLAERILDDPLTYAKRTWYIVPAGNPDAASGYFHTPLFENTRNASPHNDDLDEATDEDGFNDLNGDGYMTKMRIIHPEGEWIQVKDEPRLMRRADPAKGEQGIYRIFDEGLDADGDGKYNEDGPGGTNVNINFPHLFRAFDPESGLYPGSSPEGRAILEFAYAHPEIAMTFAFGSTNFCHTPPRGGRRGEVDLNRIEIPERYAEMFGADPDRTYTMEEVIEIVQPMVPEGVTVDESMVAGFLGLGAAVNPLEEDLAFYNMLSEDYRKYLEEKNVKEERFDPDRAKDGSFELWCYYHLGVPVFSMDLWSVPKPAREEKQGSGLSPEQLEKMTSEEFLALGEEKIAAFMEEAGVPEQFSAKEVMASVKGGQTDPAQLAAMVKQMPKEGKDGEGANPKDKANPKEKAMLDYSDQVLGGEGFVHWEKFEHPQLGEVEIGGFVPFTATTPPCSITDSILDLHLPWIFELSERLPSLGIYEILVTPKGAGVYQMEVWVENNSLIPFPTAMGRRNQQPAPAVVLLEGNGYALLSGYPRTPVGDLKGNSRKKLTWLVRADKKTDIRVRLTSKSAGSDQTTVNIGG